MHELLVIVAAFAASFLLEARPPVGADEPLSLTTVEATLDASEPLDVEPFDPS